jgi:hypothetical protein
MRRGVFKQIKEGKRLQPKLRLRVKILIRKHSSIGTRSFGFQRYYASQSPSPADRRNFIQRGRLTRRFLSCSQIHWGRPRQNKETSTTETNSKKLVYPLPHSVLIGPVLLKKRIA